MKNLLLIFGLFLALPLHGADLTWKVDDKNIVLGQSFYLTLSLTRQKGELLWPPLLTDQDLHGTMIRLSSEQLPSKENLGQEVLQVRYQLLPLKEGSQQIGPLKGDRIETKALTLEVAPAKTPNPGPMPPLQAPWEVWPMLLAILISPLAIFWPKGKSKKELAPRLSAREKALKEIDQLELTFHQQGAEPNYRALSWILREYLEGEKGVKALSQTTKEFLNNRQTQAALNAREKELLKAFLNFADLVKFAHQEADSNQQNQALTRVKELIELQEPHGV